MKQCFKMARNLSMLAAVACHPLQAGTMGPIEVNNHPVTPFVSLEGSWTAFDLDFLNSPTTVLTNRDAWGARLAGGVMYYYVNNVNFTAETGWAYLGKKSQARSDAANSVSLYGADILLGVLYQPAQWGVFLKGGTFFENVAVKFRNNTTSSLLLNGESVAIQSAINGRLTFSNVLPELKAGAIYDMDHWGVSVAYTHAFGITDPRLIFNATSSTNNVINLNASTNLRGIDVNSVLFGAYYKFV